MNLREVTLEGKKMDDFHDSVGDEETSESGLDEVRVMETQYPLERELTRAKIGKIDMVDVLGSEPITMDSGWSDSKFIEKRVITEQERPLLRSKIGHIEIKDALGDSPEKLQESQGFDQAKAFESRYITEKPSSRARTEKVSIQEALKPADPEMPPLRRVEGVKEHTVTLQQAPELQSVWDSGGATTTTVQMAYMTRGSAGSSGSEDWKTDEGFTENKSKTSRRLFSADAIMENGRLHEGHEMFDEGMLEEGVFDTNTSFQARQAAHSRTKSADLAFATETRTAKTEQIDSTEQEEKKTFVIRSVIDSDESSISLQQAIMSGVIQPEEGVYYDKNTGESIPIQTAMSKGLIKVDFTSTRRSPVKRSSMGIITVKTIREPARPHVVTAVQDTMTGEMLSKNTAKSQGLLDEDRGTFTNRSTGARMLISEAIAAGFIEVEYVGEAPPPEEVSKTYAVRAVVDTRWKRTVTFSEAVRRGIIDKDSGAFKDTVTGDKMYVGDAIMRGFLKARKIDNPATLDIDPKNKMLVDKTEKIRKKLIQPLSVISAFKKAASDAKKH